MRLARKALLALSTHRGLTAWATHSKVVRRSVTRFMPGERLDDALAAARVLRSGRMGVILTELGENLTTPDEARAVTARYAAAIDRISSEGLDAYVSVKPTQLGLDLDRPLCEAQVMQLADRAAASGRSLWIDMEGSRYIDFFLPGLMGLNLMGGGLWGVGFVIVDMRVRKLLKRFLATPMRKTDFLLAIMISRLIFTVGDVVLLVLFGYFAFGVRNQGNYLDLSAAVLIGSAAFAGIGLLVACRAKTIETVSGLMNLVMLPMWLFSGVFFSSDRFPAAFQPFIQALPLTHIISALRRVMLEGAGLAAVSGSLLILAAWAVVTFFLALRLFRWS